MNWNGSTTNPTDWQYTHQRQWEVLDPRQRTDSREQIENDPYCGYSTNHKKRPHTMMGTNAEMEHHNPSSHRPYRLNSNNFSPEMATDPDGDPLELSKVDKELARKRRELQQIEEKISLKKATIAMKRTEPFLKAKTPCQMFKEEREEDLSRSKVDSSVRNTQPFMSTGEKDIGFSNSKQSSAYNNRPLKERVNVVLQRRWPNGVLAKAFSTPSDHLPSPNPVEKTNTSTLNNDDHPLKLRVKALLNRHCHSGVLDSHGEQVPDVKLQPPSQSPSTTIAENMLVLKGFQRFLSVLNKGVDIEMLTKIVNDDPTGQELLHSQSPVVKEDSDVCKSESQRLQRGAGQRDRQSCGEERNTELLNQDISHVGGKRNIQSEEKSAQSDDRGGSHFVSSRRSRSPPVVEKKLKLEQHQEDLQNILKTIGFSLDADDQCKLAERTQERLYGRKSDTKQRLDSTALSKRSRQHVQSDHGPSSSSTSVSDSHSSSPSHHQHSPSKTFRESREQTQSSEYLHFRQRSRERGRDQGRERDGDRDENRIASRDSSSGRHQYPENPEYLAACATPLYNADVASAIPTYTSVQHSEYTAYHSDTSNGAFLNYGSKVIPPSSSSYPPGFCNYSMTPLCPSADTGALFGQVYAHPQPPAVCSTALGHSHFNTDLSLSEGQTGQQSDLCYPHAINTVQNSGSNDSPASSSYPPGFCHSMNPACPSVDTGALPGQVYPHPSAGCNDALRHSYFDSDLSLSEGQTEQRSSSHYLHIISTEGYWKYGPGGTGNKGRQSENKGKRQLKKQLALVRNSIARLHCDTPLKWINSEEKQKKLEKLTRVDQDIVKILLQKKSEGQTGKKSGLRYLHTINTVTEAKFQREENKMAEQKEGQKESQRSIQGQQLEVDLPTEEEMDANLTKKEQNPAEQILGQEWSNLKQELNTIRKVMALVNRDSANNSEKEHKFLQELAGKEQNILPRLDQNSDLSLSEGQTGQQSDLGHPHAINTVQNSGSNDSPASSSYPPVFCNSMNPVCSSVDTGALPGQVYPHPPAGCNDALGHSYLDSDLSLSEGQTEQRSGSHYLHISNTVKSRGTGNKRRQSKNKRKKQLLLRNATVVEKRIWKQLVFWCRNSIARVHCDPLINSKEKQKKLQKLAGVEQDILKRIVQNPDLSLSEGQTGQQSGLEGQKESQRSIQQQLEVELPTEEEMHANLTKKEQNPAEQINGQELSNLKQDLNTIRKVIALMNDDPANNSEMEHTFLQELAGKERNILKRLEQNSDLSLSEGQTGQQSDLHAINTVQNSGSNDSPASSSYPPGFCNSINPVCRSADTGALLGQVYPHPEPPASLLVATMHLDIPT